MKYDENIYQLYESLDSEDVIVATYYVAGYSSDLLNKAGAMAIEQTTEHGVRFRLRHRK